MFLEMDLVQQFSTGAAAGMGQTFGQRFLPWVISFWSRIWNRNDQQPTESPNDESRLHSDSDEDQHADEEQEEQEDEKPSGPSGSSGPIDAQPSVPSELTSELKQIRTVEDWNRLEQSLRIGGVPFDKQALHQLNELRDKLLAQSIEPNMVATGLARMTAEAFERAGITRPDLQRWQTISDRLAGIDSEGTGDDHQTPLMSLTGAAAVPLSASAAASATASATVPATVATSVATSKRPSTWLVWNRVDVDERQLRYTRQSLRHCRNACAQGLASLDDLASLRQIRELNEQFQLIEELLATTPKLNAETASMRLDSHMVKQILKSVEEGVLTTEQLAIELDTLFTQTPGSPSWTRSVITCSRFTSRLSQLVRDRRAIR